MSVKDSQYEFADDEDGRARVIATSDQDLAEAIQKLRDAHSDGRLWSVSLDQRDGTVWMAGGGNGTPEGVVTFHVAVLEGVMEVIDRAKGMGDDD